MTKDGKPRKTTSGMTMDTRSKKAQKSAEVNDMDDEGTEVSSKRAPLASSIDLLNDAMLHVDPNATQIPLPPVRASAVVIPEKAQREKETTDMVKDAMMDVDEGPQVYSKRTKKSVRYDSYPDPAHVIEDKSMCESLRETGLVLFLRHIPVNVICSLGTTEYTGNSSVVTLKPYDQLLIKVADDYYTDIPKFDDCEPTLEMLIGLCIIAEGGKLDSTEPLDVATTYITNNQLGYLMCILEGFIQMFFEVKITGGSNGSKVHVANFNTENLYSQIPTIEGVFKLAQHIAMNQIGEITPIHILLKYDDALAHYVNSLSSHDSTGIEFNKQTRFIPVKAGGFRPPEAPAQKHPAGSTLVKSTMGKQVPLATVSQHTLSVYDKPATKTGSSTGILVGPSAQPAASIPKSAMEQKLMPSSSANAFRNRLESMNQNMIRLGSSSGQPYIRDTSQFKSSVVMDHGIKEILAKISASLDSLNQKVDGFEKRLINMETFLVKQDETMTGLIARTSQDNLVTRETVNQTLLATQSDELHAVIKAGRPVLPVASSNFESLLDKLRSYSGTGEGAGELCEQIKTFLNEHNQTALAANVTSQTLADQRARKRLIHALHKIPQI